MVFNSRQQVAANVETSGRREFPRVSSSCLVDYRVIEDDSRFEKMRSESQGILQNISGGGVCVRVNDAPGLGSMLTLNIRLPSQPTAILALGKVCWVTRSAEGGHDVGIEFWWIGWEDSAAQEAIRGFIHESLDRDDDVDA
ncbi:MAG TPA: PilZ domain-containing protein [Planctomycetota bacterium]|jgi:Tfp pilus assembly protein PilZ|nr:PilZ domain-containing protein [Planctomycetota bacterium]